MTQTRDVAALIGRILLAIIFIKAGWDKIPGFEGTVGAIASKGIPLPQVAAAIAHAESNIDRVEYLERDTRVAAIRFAIEVSDRKHLAEVIRRIRRLNVVHGVQRI